MYKVYVCVVCGELYNEEHGDPEAGLPAGTKYEDIPDWWVCPECGATKNSLVEIDEYTN